MPLAYDNRPKSTQWSFTVPASLTNRIVARLSTLSSDTILYLTFADVDDDTNNRYVQGFIKTSKRCRVSELRGLVGPTIFTIMSTLSDVNDVLTEILLNREVFEFGDVLACNRQGHRKDITMFKRSVDSGVSSIELLKELHPKICENYPGLVQSYTKKTPLMMIEQQA